MCIRDRYCGLLLASAGARVIKIERPEGDFARSYDSGVNGDSAIFAWLNRGKESISLNLKNNDDKNLLKKMINKADVFISNITPGSLEKLDLDYSKAKLTNQRLIFCEINGYGNSEKAKSKKAYDFLIQAESGLCSVTGTESNPSKVGISITDLSTGLTAYSAILRGLIQRNKTNKGMSISISMFDVMADWMNMPLLAHRYMGGAPKRNGMKHTFIAPYGTFKCKNNDEILISIQNNREFEIFCKNILKKESLHKNPKFNSISSATHNHHPPYQASDWAYGIFSNGIHNNSSHFIGSRNNTINRFIDCPRGNSVFTNTEVWPNACYCNDSFFIIQLFRYLHKFFY